MVRGVVEANVAAVSEVKSLNMAAWLLASSPTCKTVLSSEDAAPGMPTTKEPAVPEEQVNSTSKESACTLMA